VNFFIVVSGEPRCTRIALARRQPAQAAAKGAPLPSGATGRTGATGAPPRARGILDVSLETSFTPILETKTTKGGEGLRYSGRGSFQEKNFVCRGGSVKGAGDKRDCFRALPRGKIKYI